MKKDHRGMPGGMGRGMSGEMQGTGGRTTHKRAVSKGGGNKKRGIGSSQVKVAHNRHKMNNQKIISAMRKS